MNSSEIELGLGKAGAFVTAWEDHCDDMGTLDRHTRREVQQALQAVQNMQTLLGSLRVLIEAYAPAGEPVSLQPYADADDRRVKDAWQALRETCGDQR